MTGQICAGRGAVKQPHDPFNQDQVSFASGLPQQAPAFLCAHHPQIDLIHRRTAGALQNHRVEEIRATFKHPHLAPLIAMQTGQRGGNGGLALTGSRRGDQYRRAMTRLSHA